MACPKYTESTDEQINEGSPYSFVNMGEKSLCAHCQHGWIPLLIARNSLSIHPGPRYIFLSGRHAYPRIITNPVYNDELGVALLLFVPPSFLCFNIMFDNVRTWRSICLSGVGLQNPVRVAHPGLMSCSPLMATRLSSIAGPLFWQLDSRPDCRWNSWMATGLSSRLPLGLCMNVFGP